MQKFDSRQLTLAAMIAAAYAALTMALPALSYGSLLQIRFSEALTVLPFLFPAATPGVIVGCLVANVLSPYGLLDMVVGTLATALAAVWTSKLKNKYLAPLPPVLCNGIILGGMFAFYEVGFGPAFVGAFALHACAVAFGQLIACYGLGLPLLQILPKVKYFQGLRVPDRLV